MKTKVMFCLMPLILILSVGAYAIAAEVAQGKCLSYDTQKNVVTLDEYDLNFSPENRYGRSTGKQAVYNLANAKIGVPPAVGDIIRIAYEMKGDQRNAIKLMNVSKQDLSKK
ncbi:MAG: hypothetical protein NTW27_08170 [Deltaproteobacteria bacterium]|nr:hypothetical protein [Deltaproteobacteria bacterium]